MINKVTDPSKIVTDVVLLSALAKQGIDKDYVEFIQDYAPAYYADGRRAKGRSPYAKFYRDLKSNKKFAIISGLPMVDANGAKIEAGWVIGDKGTFTSKNNLFQATVNQGGTTTIIIKNDQPDGRRAGDNLTFRPQLFLGKVELACGAPTLLPVDPVNPNYAENVIEWDYDICRRRLRLVEGRMLGSWVFDSRPKADIAIRYNQSGDFRLRLAHARGEDEEFVPVGYFDNPAFGWPVAIEDSLPFYPDADPETTSMDGYSASVGDNSTWVSRLNSAGTLGFSASSAANGGGVQFASGSSSLWGYVYRPYHLFDTSALPDGASITEATLSYYGAAKIDDNGATPTMNVYSSNPTTNTDIVQGDFAKSHFGTTPFSTAKSYADFLVADPFWNDFTLNGDGLAAISKTGVSKFTLREPTYDIIGTEPTRGGNTKWTYMLVKPSEAGNGYKPKLVVTYSTTTAVGDTIQQIWNVRAALADASQYVWNIKHTLADTAQFVWNVGHGVSDAIQTVWNTRSVVTDSVQTVWNVLHLVALGTNSIVWNVRGLLADAAQIVWNVKTTVSDASQYVWNIRHTMPTASQLIWNVRHALKDSVQVVWNVLHMVALGINTYLWNLRYALKDSSIVRWRIRYTVTTTTQYIWNVWQRVASTVQGVWNVRALVAGASTLVYNVRALGTRTVQWIWNVLHTKGFNYILRWKVRKPTVPHLTVYVYDRSSTINLRGRSAMVHVLDRAGTVKLRGRAMISWLRGRNLTVKLRTKKNG